MKKKFETERLQARIKEKFGSQAAFARAIGMERSTVKKILDEGREWKGSKLYEAIKVLEISSDDIDSYFFTPAVEELQRERA